MSFYLVRLEPDASGNMIEVPLSDHDPYEKGSDAAKAAKTLTDIYGFKVQPRRMNQAGDWRERQAKRLADGTLTPLPAKWDLEPIKDHYAHLDPVRHQGMICFTENDQLGIIDRVTVLTPGRYISRFYETEGKMEDERRRKLIAAIDPSGEILYARTPEEIERVYREGPSSCMDGTHTFDTPVWPTSVYGAGDLAVAYTVNNRGRIQSRCLVWPDKKLYGRIYGDVERMIKQLEAEGYETDRGDDHSVDGNAGYFIGARVLKVLFEDDRYAVLPYFDDIALCLDAGDHWITADETPGKDDAEHPDVAFSGSTSGYVQIRQWCPKMEDYYEKGTFRTIRGVEGHTQWSWRAVDVDGFTCDETGEAWPKEQMVVLSDGYRVCKEWFAANGTTCEITNSNIRKSEVVEYEGKRTSKSYVRQIEREEQRRKEREEWARRDRELAEQRERNRRRNERFYDAVSPMLDSSLTETTADITMSDLVRMERRRNDDWYRNDFRDLTDRAMRDALYYGDTIRARPMLDEQIRIERMEREERMRAERARYERELRRTYYEPFITIDPAAPAAVTNNEPETVDVLMADGSIRRQRVA